MSATKDLKTFIAASLSKEGLAQITVDYLKEIRRAFNESDIEGIEGYDYELELILEVMDKNRFPDDYKILTELAEVLEEIFEELDDL